MENKLAIKFRFFNKNQKEFNNKRKLKINFLKSHSKLQLIILINFTNKTKVNLN
jgi:hypothetical protein